MKRVKILAAALPAAVGLAAPVTAHAATVTGTTVTTATTHGKKVAYPRTSHQQLMGTAVPASAVSSSPPVPGSRSGASPDTNRKCANGSKSCFSVFGTEQLINVLHLGNWVNSNGGTRTGFVDYKNSSTGVTKVDFRARTKSEPKGTPYNFTWATECVLPAPGTLTGHMGGHTATVHIQVLNGSPAGHACSNT